ncbi:hypothetical protein CSUI_006613 [Cystoisospora suis]|uniref:Uncharacterized protein n=1 Tax=Cystoisospora suis TaxID=483139 RepID=A0A2C6KTE7_9APIC|nr:hypothetical protein CSUI_006613 [Cystoisospora suis]
MCARSCFSRGEPKWGSQGAFDSGSRLTEKSGEMYHGGTRDERGQDRESVADLARGNRRQNVRTEKKGMRHRVCRSDSDSGADVFSDPTCVRVLNANGESSTTDRIKRQRIGDEFYHLVSKDTHMDTVPPATTGFMEPFCDIRGCRERAAAISRTTEKPLAVDIVPVCDDESVGSAAHKVAEVSTSSVGEPRHPLTLSCIERGAELPPERGRQGGRDRFDREHRGDGGLTDASVEDAGGNRENQARDASRHILQTKRESLGGDFGVSVSGVVSNRRNVVGGVLREKKESTFPALGVAQRNDSCSRCSGQTQDAEEGESLLESEQSTRLVEEEGGRSSPECAFSCSGTESSPTAEEDVLCGEADRERRESDTSLSLWSQLLKEEEELRRRDAAPPSAFIALWREGPRRRSSAEGLLGAGTDDVDALLRCTSAHLSCVILVTSSKIMERWRELGLSAGWRWFQRKVLRRMTRAQLKRWAVKGDAGTTASATRRKNVFGPREAETMTDAEASTADLIELPEELAQSSDHIAWKMTTANWELLYESVQAEMGYRARLYSEKLLRLHEHLVEQVAELIEDRLDLEQHLLCLPCFSGDSGRPNSGGFTGYEDLDPLPKDSEPSGHQMKLPVPRWKRCIPLLRKATTGAFSLIRGLNEVWDEYEEWAEMVCHVLDCLDFRITQEREACDQKWPHTPNLGDVAKLQFRTFCIFDSRLMPCICVSVYALIHELEEQLGRSSVDPSGPETIRSPQATANSTGEPAVQRDTQQTAKTATGAASSQRKYLSRARSASAMELFEALMQRFEELDVADDGLMSRVTRQEFRMYFMTPIKETFHHLSYASWNVS